MKTLTQLFGQTSNTRTGTILLILAVLFQLSVVGSQLVNAAYPHFNGKTVNVATVPYDPRSLFRGNYARLNYDFNVLSATQLGISNQTLKEMRIGESVYVVLKLDRSNIYQFDRAQLTSPNQLGTDEVMLHGLIASKNWRSAQRRRVDFGIDAFFAPKKKALALQSDLRQGGVATLKVTAGGRAALVDVSAKPKP